VDCRAIEQGMTKLLGLKKRPVAVKFLDAPPAGIERFVGTEPAGCGFWRLAANGRTFYTVPSDHYNCPIGSYTHNFSLPPERSTELEQTLGLMAQAGYIKMEEVPGIMRLPKAPAAVVYAPLGDAPMAPDVALFTGLAAQIMLIEEAALRAGCAAALPVLARPTCMALPAAMAHGAVVSSGCIGNRVYTGLEEGEMYCVIPERHLERVASELDTVAGANRELANYHESRKSSLTSTLCR
jgi:uncharacterized protein (DUF169 family)